MYVRANQPISILKALISCVRQGRNYFAVNAFSLLSTVSETVYT